MLLCALLIVIFGGVVWSGDGCAISFSRRTVVCFFCIDVAWFRALLKYMFKKEPKLKYDFIWVPQKSMHKKRDFQMESEHKTTLTHIHSSTHTHMPK